jgi:flagellar motor switch protein FliN/FliY
MAENNENTEVLAETAIPEEFANEKKPNNSQGISGSIGEEDKAEPHAFSDLSNTPNSAPKGKIEFILDIPLEITAELGRTKMVINDLLKLGQGSIIELSKPAGGNLEILANQKLVARGEVVVVNEKYGIRLTEIVSPTERIESLK